MEHSFDIDIAKEYGIECAIILKHLYFWIEKNKACDRHFHDGRYWTYSSRKAFMELFPYISDRKIRSVLDKLENEALVITGNFNKMQYDRTKWYALTDKAYSIMESHVAKTANALVKTSNGMVNMSNGMCGNVQPIPDITTYITTDNKKENTKRKNFVPPTVEEVKEYIDSVGSQVDAESFVAFYESKDWMIGKNKMKSWKAAIVTWEKRNGLKRSTPKKSDPVQQEDEELVGDDWWK